MSQFWARGLPAKWTSPNMGVDAAAWKNTFPSIQVPLAFCFEFVSLLTFCLAMKFQPQGLKRLDAISLFSGVGGLEAGTHPSRSQLQVVGLDLNWTTLQWVIAFQIFLVSWSWKLYLLCLLTLSAFRLLMSWTNSTHKIWVNAQYKDESGQAWLAQALIN